MLDINEIMELLPHRFPMLMLDLVTEVVPGEAASGIKCVSCNEPYFTGHFPEKPVMPGIFIVEALAQLSHLMIISVPEYRDKAVYYAKIDKAMFYRTVFPGTTLKLETSTKSQLDNLFVCSVRASVEGEDVFKGYISLVLTEFE